LNETSNFHIIIRFRDEDVTTVAGSLAGYWIRPAVSNQSSRHYLARPVLCFQPRNQHSIQKAVGPEYWGRSEVLEVLETRVRLVVRRRLGACQQPTRDRRLCLVSTGTHDNQTRLRWSSRNSGSNGGSVSTVPRRNHTARSCRRCTMGSDVRALGPGEVVSLVWLENVVAYLVLKVVVVKLVL
jgi:hypothetical protein